tara:strand:- start:116 stop:223 length:108 start_codon:yes stop_codon:yes gene_type:complete
MTELQQIGIMLLATPIISCVFALYIVTAKPITKGE